MRSAGIGAGLIAGVVALIWLGSGFFIVQEGQQAVVTSFGRYSHTVDAGFQWRLPYPFQAHETVTVTQLRSKEVGRNAIVQATGLRDSSMLTQDENIVDIRFTVQYRLKDARAFLFENRDPDEAVMHGRRVGGARDRRQEPDRLRAVRAARRDRRRPRQVGPGAARPSEGRHPRVNVNLQSVQPPEQVQAAFEDTLKAGQDGDRAKKEGQAYASDVIPKAQGSAARLREEAEGYKARVIAQAEGDAQRFSQVLAEYQKAPTVTRDRLYIDTMQQIYSQRVQGDGRQPQQLEPALPAARQADAAGRRDGPAAGAWAARRPPIRRPPAAASTCARATASAAASAKRAERRSNEP